MQSAVISSADRDIRHPQPSMEILLKSIGALLLVSRDWLDRKAIVKKCRRIRQEAYFTQIENYYILPSHSTSTGMGNSLACPYCEGAAG